MVTVIPEYDHSHGDGDLGNNEAAAAGYNTIAAKDGQWKDWTSTWRKAGTASSGTRHVTMTGTITRGKKCGESVDVELDLTDRELMQITLSREHIDGSQSEIDHGGTADHSCGVNKGLHIVLFGLVLFPFIVMASIFVSFYFGMLTWHNVFTHFYDERSILHRITLCPILVLTFPLAIIAVTFPLAFYAGLAQLRWSFEDWKDEVGSFEKGFYGWLCSRSGLESCSPYTVVTLTETDSPAFSCSDTSSSSSAQGQRVADA